ncbi:ScbR family autoregulator-binding transcription factor [Micromonosporaceae bacterium Da 78-11]
MRRQTRAIRTRQSILLAAAAVFDQRGYGAATVQEILDRAGVTKGAMYFHFASKEDLARTILELQLDAEPTRGQSSKVQELVDQGLVFAYRLRHEPLMRASVGLAMDPWSVGIDRQAPFLAWIARTESLLVAARDSGELLPHVDPARTAEMLVGAFSGIQELSHVFSDRADLVQRVVLLLRHILPSIALPGVLTALDYAEERAQRLLDE